jgi:hypothetical protein
VSFSSLRTTLVGMLVAGLILATRVVGWPLVRPGLPPRAEARATAIPATVPALGDSFVHAVVAHDPFRLGRRPGPIVYDPLQLTQPAAPPPPRPVLVLSGIVWDGGASPTALVEGLPGADASRAVRAGETVGGLRVKRIERDRVVIAGLDTTWVLTVREPWK